MSRTARPAPSAEPTLQDFADEVGPTGPVVVVGGRTQWEVGGEPDPSARQVRAPTGVVSHQPAEMIVRVRAGTPVAELDRALAEGGQSVALDPADPERATVGGVLAVGHSGPRRLGWGPVRDAVLEARFVSAEGRLIRAGAPVVKNVSGFDLCRLLVGSLGTIGLLAEVVLRLRPRAPAAQWLSGSVDDPGALRRLLLRPSSILWDGTTTWVLLEGHQADVEAEARLLGPSFDPAPGPPPLPGGGRWSVRTDEIAGFLATEGAGRFVAEVGVGIVHTVRPAPPRRPGHTDVELHRRIKANFDPSGRLNPGRSVT